MFGRLLGISKVGALEIFFDLGGNSLLVMRALAALRELGAASLQVASMFADPTVQGIAEAIDGGEDSQGWSRRQVRSAPVGGQAMSPSPSSAWQGVSQAQPLSRNSGACSRRSESIRYFRPDELDASIPAALRASFLTTSAHAA